MAACSAVPARRAGGGGVDVGAGDDAAVAGAGDRGEVDAEVLGVLAHRRLGQRPRARRWPCSDAGRGGRRVAGQRVRLGLPADLEAAVPHRLDGRVGRGGQQRRPVACRSRSRPRADDLRRGGPGGDGVAARGADGGGPRCSAGRSPPAPRCGRPARRRRSGRRPARRPPAPRPRRRRRGRASAPPPTSMVMIGVADVDHRAGVEQQLGDGAGVRRGQLDGGLGRLHLAQRLVHRDGVADGDQPLQDLALGEALTDVGQLELPQVAMLRTPASGRRRRAPGRGRAGTPLPASTAGTGCRSRRPAAPAPPASGSRSR